MFEDWGLGCMGAEFSDRRSHEHRESTGVCANRTNKVNRRDKHDGNTGSLTDIHAHRIISHDARL